MFPGDRVQQERHHDAKTLRRNLGIFFEICSYFFLVVLHKEFIPSGRPFSEDQKTRLTDYSEPYGISMRGILYLPIGTIACFKIRLESPLSLDQDYSTLSRQAWIGCNHLLVIIVCTVS
jgi:hypothetical protein